MKKFIKDDLNFTTKFKGSDLYIDERKNEKKNKVYFY
jgi:hypothetical protein